MLHSPAEVEASERTLLPLDAPHTCLQSYGVSDSVMQSW